MAPATRAPDDSAMAVPLSVPRSGEIAVRQILKDGELVAVLMAVDQGDSFTVVTEVFGQGERVQRRPYTFANANAALAFVNEAVTSFTYLGCEIRQL